MIELTFSPLSLSLSIPPCAEHLNASFVQFLLDVVEEGLPSDPTEQLPDLCVNLILAFNLHLTGESTEALDRASTFLFLAICSCCIHFGLHF